MSEVARSDASPLWPPTWTRATLPLLALTSLGQASGHGYDLIKRLQQSGFSDVKGPNLYPVLERLEESGLLSSAWVAGVEGPGRRVYEVTAAGKQHLKVLNQQWQLFSNTVTNHLPGGQQ